MKPMDLEKARWTPELAVEIVPTEREEAERSPTRAHDDFWLWNTDPKKTTARKDVPS